MRRIIFSILVLAFSCSVLAQTNFNVTVADKKRIVTGSISPQKDDREIFANALLWAINRGDQLKNLIIECDYEKKRFTMTYNIVKENASSFAAKLTVQVNQGRLVYLVSDIKGQASGLNGVLGASAFDKMNPDKKPKQKLMIEEFEAANKQELQSFFSYIKQTHTDISFWNSIVESRLEKGMQMSDVLLILGKPVDTQSSGETIQLMYNQFTYVFLENGKVKTFMQ